ncbi:MAG TPA: hypothetical protein VNI83_08635 [Vicinamibacterales bacterium]|nr:hypothetical protein [Vicinamibacterales bacterium]
MSILQPPYRRPQAAELARRLAEPRRFIKVVAGPRQVGKSTLVQQVVDGLGPRRATRAQTSRRCAGRGWIAQQHGAA